MEANIFNAISDSDFRIKAFNDYCNDTQQSYQKLLQAETMALESIPDDPEDDSVMDYDIKAEEILNGLDISTNNMLLFNEGYISSKDYISNLIKGFKETIVDEDGTLEDKFVDLKDAAGNIVNSVNLDQLSLEIKENLYSVTALCAANAAATIDNVADRIAIFNDKITSVFQNAYSTISSTATYLRSMVADVNFRSEDYLAKIDAITGVSHLASDNSTELPVDMDITKYTGANPACALNFNGVFSTVNTIANVGLKVVGGILSVGASLAGKLFSKVGNYFHQAIVDPFDLEEINSDVNSYTIDGWRYNNDPSTKIGPSGTYYFFDHAEFNSYIKSSLSDDEIQNYVGKWVKYETIFGELMFNLDSFTYPRWEGGSYFDYYTFHPYVQFKPKAVNPDAVYLSAKTVWGEDVTNPARRFINSTFQSRPTAPQLLAFLDNLKNQPNLYLTTDSDEKKLCLAFACGASLNAYFGKCAFYEMFNSIADEHNKLSYLPFEFVNIDDWIAVDLKRNVTNIDFVQAASGWSVNLNCFVPMTFCPHDEDFSWTDFPFPSVHNTGEDFGRHFFLAWILNRADRKMRPLNYTFVPYRNNVDTWNESRFRIKTDSENQNAFNSLLTTIIVVVGVAVLAITSTILIKKAVRALYMRRTAAVGKLDKAMWNGEKLSSRDKRKYIRLQRKLNGSTALSSGLQDSQNLFSSVSNAVSTVSEDVSGVSQIATLIKS